MTTRIIYNKGMVLPIVSGRQDKSARRWHAEITLMWDTHTDVIELQTDEKCRAVDLIPVLHAEIEPIFAEHGEPKHYKISARSM